MSPERRILLADDDPREIELFLLAMGKLNLAHRVDVVQDGEAALDYLARSRASFPAVAILDLKMPVLGGLEVLRLIRSDPELNPLPVVFFTSSMQERDHQDSTDGGVNDYVVKPLDLADYMAAVERLGTRWVLEGD